MDAARGWLIGIAVIAILAVGILAWFDLDPTSDTSETRANEMGFPTATQAVSNSWEDAAPNFIAGDVAAEDPGNGSAGWGKLTVQDLCLQEDIDLALAESRLEAYGLATGPSQRIRDLAEASGYKPSEVADILRGNEPGVGCDDPDCDHDSKLGGEHEEHDDGECDDEACDDHTAKQ